MKLKWKVDPPPTGRWRSFECRGWPTAEYEDGTIAAHIRCEDAYIPSLVKEGRHAPLIIIIYDYSKPNGNCPWTRMKLMKPAATLREAKERVKQYLKSHPEVFPKEM